MLEKCEDGLAGVHDVALFDLDGVVYVGGGVVPGAAEHIAAARARGLRASYVTNNASRTPDEVAAHLRELGVPAAAADVVTSAQAAARILVDEFGPGARVVALGGGGLVWALREAGLQPVGAEDEADAVASGFGPEVRWREIMRVASRIRDGLPWVASNTDATFPTPDGVAPGHGVLVETISRFAGVAPVVAGKPARPLLAETIRRTGARRPLMVGDRLDTDIEGARNAGFDALLVLTGVTGLPELVAAGPQQRPTHLSPDLAGLVEPHPGVVTTSAEVRVGGWSVSVSDGRMVIAGDGSLADWWRGAAVAAWRSRDATGRVVDVTSLTVPQLPGSDR